MSEPWVHVRTRSRCPCGDAGASVLESGTDRCLSHGHEGAPEALRWARDHRRKLVLSDELVEWVMYQLDRQGFELKEGMSANDALDLLLGTAE